MDEEYKQDSSEDVAEERFLPESENDMAAASRSTKIEVTDEHANLETVSEEPDLTAATEGDPTPDEAEVSSEDEHPESPMIDPEIEPETVAFSPEPASAESVADVEGEAPTEGTTYAFGTPAPVASGLATKSANKRRLIGMVAAGLALVIIIGVAVWLLIFNKDDTVVDTTPKTTQPAVVEQPKMAIAATTTEGTTEYSVDGTKWLPLTTSTKLSEGNSVRTGDEGRAVLTLADGSVLRFDANSTVELTSLAADKIEVHHTTGRMYSRLVPGDRKYIVTVDGSTLEALGTAFISVRDTEKSGLQVYHGTVQASDITTGPIAEGKQYYRPFGDFVGPLEVSDMDIDALTQDAFIQWNILEDEKNSIFKNSMGVLAKIKQRTEELEKERLAEEARLKAEKEAAEKAAAEKAAAEKAAAEKKEAEEKAAEEEKVSMTQQNRTASARTFASRRR